MERKCNKCGGLIVSDEDFVYSIQYEKCFSCGKRFFDKGEKMEILIKIPTRGRPEQFFSMIDLYMKYLTNKDKTSFLITIDEDDETMNNEMVKEYMEVYGNSHGVEINYILGSSLNKIDAINRDLAVYTKECNQIWDILVLASDDMLPVFEGYDGIIRRDMKDHFPDTDGVLYYPDGYTPLNTFPILGKKYYERFNYIYNPVYKSFFCDNEFHEVANLLGKQYHSQLVMFSHEHPANTGRGWDELYQKNNSTWEEDKQTYFNHRKSNYIGCLGKEVK